MLQEEKMSSMKMQRNTIANMAAILGPHLQQTRALTQELEPQGPWNTQKDSGTKEPDYRETTMKPMEDNSWWQKPIPKPKTIK